MTIHAYREIYLSKAQSLLGEAFDYAVNTCNMSGDTFVKMFAVSTVSKRIEKGDPALLAGKSGVEMTMAVVNETTGKELNILPSERFGRSAEYWIGWAIAYYQWWSMRSFKSIFKALNFSDLQQMYYTLHEADISKFVSIAEERMKEIYPETNMKRLRAIYGCSQSELAKSSGVSLRSIQMYEQRKKDINKASAETLLRISKVLGCTMEDLIEKNDFVKDAIT